MKRALIGVFAAWAAIVALAWWLADRRISICYMTEDACKVAATAARDYVLIAGLALPLLIFAVLLLTGYVRFERLKRHDRPRPASRELRRP